MVYYFNSNVKFGFFGVSFMDFGVGVFIKR